MEENVLTSKQVTNLAKNLYNDVDHLILEINRALIMAKRKEMKTIKISCYQNTMIRSFYQINWGEFRDQNQTIGLYPFEKKTIQRVIVLYKKTGWQIKTTGKFSTVSGPSYEFDLPVI